jgi:hypothetical protein
LETDGSLTDQQKNSTGRLTIPNGTYHYFDSNDNRVDVNGGSRTFDVLMTYEEPDYYEFEPHINGSYVGFRGAADGGLQGKSLSWSLLGVNLSGNFPNFRTFRQQMAAYVPYVERDSSGRNYAFRMVNPSSPQTAVSIPVSGRYRLRMRGADGKTFFRSDWKEYEAGANPAHTVVLPNDIDPQGVKRVFVDARLREDAYNPDRVYCYGWRLDVCDRSNEGLADDSVLTSPLSLEVGEEKEFRVTFKDGYYASETGILISDESVLENTSWNYDESTRTCVFTLKALKPGRTNFSVTYDDNVVGWYHTAYTDAIVGDGGSGGSPADGSGGGGGCGASGGWFAALALGAAVLAVKKRCWEN